MGLRDVAVELTSRSAETCGEGCSQGDACCIPCQFIPFACLTLATLYAPKFEPMRAYTVLQQAREAEAAVVRVGSLIKEAQDRK